MEHIHGVDVSWMSHGSKERTAKPIPRRRNTVSSPQMSRGGESSSASPPPLSSPLSASLDNPSPLSAAPAPQGSRLQRRPSWFSNLSSKFSSTPATSPPQTTSTPPKQAELSVPRANPAKNAVLQHAAKYEGEGPYIPAPPKSSTPAGFLHVLRRLSTNSGGLSPSTKGNHGLVERRVLNVDQHRERCQLAELNQAKLRRVAFCVDVEIAPMPKYADQECATKKPAPAGVAPKANVDEKKEATKLEPPEHAVISLHHHSHVPAVSTAPASAPTTATTTTAAEAPRPIPVPEAHPAAADRSAEKDSLSASPTPATGADGKPAADGTRKKEKKKKSEEERKARKERKRKLAEANGIIPMEIYLDSEDSDSGGATTTAATSGTSTPAAPRPQVVPTTNPVRIYRRCCQLRETPVLKKIVEQLSDSSAVGSGIVAKLDLTGYWMQLADLITLGDFLAVVPIRELILENSGLNDEGLRVILAGLLAAKKPQKRHGQAYYRRHLADNTNQCQLNAAFGMTSQGGFVERLVLKNNKIGIDGWNYVCLFIHMCRSLRVLDMSKIALPRQAVTTAAQQPSQGAPPKAAQTTPKQQQPQSQRPCMFELLAKSLRGRLGGAKLELLNFGDTGITACQLGLLVDGVIECGTKRLGLAHNDLDDESVTHVARYLSSGVCEGLDLGGNDLRDRLENLADAVSVSDSLWGLGLANCNLRPNSLSKLLVQLVKLHNFRFLDLSHNHDLFQCRPSATPLLRRYLPEMESLKRVHLADVSMNSEQAIAIAEIIPEIKELAHLNILENPELTKLANARTEEAQEQACAFYASFLAATRLSTSIIAVDMDTPSAETTEIIRGMAKQVVAYCLRNVERVTSRNSAIIDGDALAGPHHEDAEPIDVPDVVTSTARSEIEYPDVIQHLVGHDATILDEVDEDEVAPDDNYVIGGTGVAQALACCLKNRGSESGQPSGDVVRDDDGTITSITGETFPVSSKAKDMSKHLLQSARKIRKRLQPALQKARIISGANMTYQRLLFLDQTLDGIIKRFENEFPETRVSADSGVPCSPSCSGEMAETKSTTPSLEESNEGEVEPDAGADAEPDTAAATMSDGEDDTEIRPSGLMRSNSVISLSSKGLTNEEGRVLRAGHRFRAGWFKHYSLLSGVDEIESDPNHKRMLYELIHEVNDAGLNQKLAEKGIVRLYKEDRMEILETLKAQDPEHWARFMESQEKTRANIRIGMGDLAGDSDSTAGLKLADVRLVDGSVPATLEEAIDDDSVEDS